MIPRRELAAIRFGDGLPEGPSAGDPAALLAGLSGPDAMAKALPGIDTATAAALRVRGAEAATRFRAEPASTEAKAAFDTTRAALRDSIAQSARATLARALDTPTPLRERLVRFWTDHFTTRTRGRYFQAYPSAHVEDAIRPHLSGRFADLLRAAILHPAMLVYLDQSASMGPGSAAGLRRGRGLNENLARELLELHTLGVGAAYVQHDVTELAELLTGLVVNGQGAQEFRPAMAEPGPETVLGAAYRGEGITPVLALLDDLAARPETAAHIARKLAVHFVSDTPDPGLVAAMEVAFLRTDGDLAAVYVALLAHPAAWAEPFQKVRQPVDFIAAALRGLGVRGADLMALPDRTFRRHILQPMALMGQPWQAPRGPDGWPEAAADWITPQLLAARVAWAMEAPGELLASLPEPRDLVARVLGSAGTGPVAWAATRAETRAEGAGVIFASPAFNRR